MNIIESWKNSLQLPLTWNNLKPFLTRVIYDILPLYKEWFKRAWMLLLVAAVATVVIPRVGLVLPRYLVNLILAFFMIMSFGSLYQAAKSIIGTPEVYKINYWHTVYLVLLFILPLAVMGLLILLSPFSLFMGKTVMGQLPNNLEGEVLLGQITAVIMNAVLCFIASSALIIFTMMFFFDTAPTFTNFWRSFVRACKMVIYNAPVILLSYILLFCIHEIIDFLLIPLALLLVLLVPALIFFVSCILLVPIAVCLYTHYFYKRIAEQRDAYV